ncbi:MAG: class I SAM-dependent methyltransferase [candidate division Zixibacteria bacterium]
MLDKKGFDKWAGNYDESIIPCLNAFPFDGYYDVLSAVISLSDPEEGLRILDVGIGTGLLSEELRKSGCIIHGIDFSEKMLEKARIRISDGIFEIVDVSIDHFGKFNNNRYDRIITSYFFHHLNPHQQTSFVKRSLKENLLPDGKLIIADIGFENESDYEAARVKFQDGWEDDEFYLCGESIVYNLQTEKIKAQYIQISCCAGILVCTFKPDYENHR